MINVEIKELIFFKYKYVQQMNQCLFFINVQVVDIDGEKDNKVIIYLFPFISKYIYFFI